MRTRRLFEWMEFSFLVVETAAAKFVNGPDDPESPGNEESAFGAVPEPGTVALLTFGLAGLGQLGRRRA